VGGAGAARRSFHEDPDPEKVPALVERIEEMEFDERYTAVQQHLASQVSE